MIHQFHLWGYMQKPQKWGLEVTVAHPCSQLYFSQQFFITVKEGRRQSIKKSLPLKFYLKLYCNLDMHLPKWVMKKITYMFYRKAAAERKIYPIQLKKSIKRSNSKKMVAKMIRYWRPLKYTDKTHHSSSSHKGRDTFSLSGVGIFAPFNTLPIGL